MYGSREAVLENVRKYRAIASLYRQTAAFRPLQKWSLLEQASEWENLALTTLESWFVPVMPGHDRPARGASHGHPQWETMAAA